MTDPAKPANDIFQAGMDARGQGKPVEACPYPMKAASVSSGWRAGTSRTT